MPPSDSVTKSGLRSGRTLTSSRALSTSAVSMIDADNRHERGVETMRGRGPAGSGPDRRRRACSRLRIGVVGDQPARPADLVHDLVAGVDAQRAGDAFELLAVADVDAHRADGDACLQSMQSPPCPPSAWPLLCGAARLAAPVVVGDEQRVLVEHRALDARPGAHVGADLLAHEAAEDDRWSR